MRCPLSNDGETLQEHCVTVTREKWDSSTKSMNRKNGPLENMRKKCDSPHNTAMRTGHQ